MTRGSRFVKAGMAVAVWSLACLPATNADEATLAELGIAPTAEDVARCLQWFAPDEKAVAEIRDHLERLGDDRFAERQRAARALLGCPILPNDLLEEAANSPDAEIRYRVRLIRQRRGQAHSERVLRATLTAVADRKLPGTAAEILAALETSVDDGLWGLAGEALAATAREADYERIRAALASRHPMVRAVAIHALAAAGDREVAADLRPLLNDSHERVALAAALALADWGDRSSLPVLVRLLESKDMITRWESIRALRFLTRQDLAYHPRADAGDRATAVSAWRDWLGKHAATANLRYPLQYELDVDPDSVVGRRSPERRGHLVGRYGGNRASEAAVAAGLRWLAEHQLDNGSWDFDHRRGGPCQTNPGSLQGVNNAATAMALLALLGAGNTPRAGLYRRDVELGVRYLVGQATAKKVPAGWADLSERGGSMYSHALASIALCEAFAQTGDTQIAEAAQRCVDFIIEAQDPQGGGWRYQPRQPGDTSVFGWQLTALKIGESAHLAVKPDCLDGATRFLDSVQTDGGAKYGYTKPGGGNATTAIGLLGRMYLGWKCDEAALRRGVAHLAQIGPSNGNMYYNYYATQVLFHYGGENWSKWNRSLRDYLVETQAKQGAEAGSWFFAEGDHGAQRGGRLYCTALAALILEVYYRYPPLCRQTAAARQENDAL